MAGEKEYLTNYVESRSGNVTFGNGVMNKVVGYGILNIEEMPKLKKVIHVEKMKANLISVSRLCDDDLDIYFDKR